MISKNLSIFSVQYSFAAASEMIFGAKRGKYTMKIWGSFIPKVYRRILQIVPILFHTRIFQIPVFWLWLTNHVPIFWSNVSKYTNLFPPHQSYLQLLKPSETRVNPFDPWRQKVGYWKIVLKNKLLSCMMALRLLNKLLFYNSFILWLDIKNIASQTNA